MAARISSSLCSGLLSIGPPWSSAVRHLTLRDNSPSCPRRTGLGRQAPLSSLQAPASELPGRNTLRASRPPPGCDTLGAVASGLHPRSIRVAPTPVPGATRLQHSTRAARSSESLCASGIGRRPPEPAELAANGPKNRRQTPPPMHQECMSWGEWGNVSAFQHLPLTGDSPAAVNWSVETPGVSSRARCLEARKPTYRSRPFLGVNHVNHGGAGDVNILQHAGSAPNGPKTLHLEHLGFSRVES